MKRTVDILIEISIYSAVITAFILLFRAAFKKRISPKVQYAMWLLLVLRLMLPVTIESGFYIENILPERPAPVVRQESVFEIEAPVIDAAPVIIQPATDVQIDNTWTPEESSPAIPQGMPESAPSAVPEEIEPAHDINWRLVAFWVWAAGAMIFSIWMMIVKLRFYEDMQQGITSVSPKVYAIYDECCAALNVKPLTMWAVDRAISPGIAFFTYPVLLLPASMDGDEDKLRYAFLHELTHKKRYDHYMTALLNVLRILYWFNPAVHIGFSEMRADMETACDADVIAFVGKEQKRGYLTAILELFSYASRPQLGMSQASSRRMAKRRMKGTFMRERTTFLGRAAALTLAVIMLVGCFTTACQSAPVEVELKAANTVEVINHQQAWERFEDIFNSEVRGVIGSAQEYHDDLDGDGLADHAAFSGEGKLVTVELSSGGSINADAMELYEISRWGGDFLAMGQDLTGDGKNEVILLINSGGTGGDGQYLLYVYTVGGKEWKSMDTPASGFPVTVEWDCENIMVSRRFDTDFEPMEGGYSAIVADAETVQKYYAVMADREPWLELRDTPYTSDFAADAFCDIAVTSWRGEPVLAAAQYIAGPGGIHADRLGYFVSLIKWNDKGGYEVVDEFFASLRFALLNRDAKDTDLINPDPIDALSDMDLLTYAALEQGNGTYALPRTLTGNDLSLSIWDNILLTVNDRYFDGKLYDAAGAAYNVVDVRQNQDGIIDVYLILTYQQYLIKNDELSVDRELNGAAIWHYKENENGEIEFVRVTWPEKDGDGYASSIKKNWPEDLQKYAEFSPDSIGRAERLKAIDEQIAISMDNTTNVASLLGTITSSPKGSSARIDYIHEHVGEYGQLCAMGRRAVSHFMPRFEKGYETGLEGQIMAAVLNALTGIGLVYDHANGQEWYDANRNEILASEWAMAVQPASEPEPTPTPDPTPPANSISYDVTVAKRTAQATANVNVRSGPGTHYDKLGQLKKGEVVPQVGTVNEWVKILWNGQKAYIREDYCILHNQAQENAVSLADVLEQSGYFKKNANIYLGVFGEPTSDVLYIRVSGGVNADRVAKEISSLITDKQGLFKVVSSSLPSYVNDAYIKELMNSIARRMESLSAADKELCGFNAMYYDPAKDQFIVELLDMDDTKIANFRQMISNWDYITFIPGNAIAIPMA